MLIDLILSHPATRPDLWAALLADGAHRWGCERTYEAAARRPNLTSEQIASLTDVAGGSVWIPLMSRPDMTPTRAIDLWGSTTHPHPLTETLSRVHDPDDTLVYVALARSGHAAVAGRALRAATTHAGRAHAALTLAPQPRLADEHVRQLHAYVLDYPHRLAELTALAVAPNLTSDLAALHDPDAAPGTVQWCVRASVDELIAHAGAGGALGWAQVLYGGQDPDATLARAALDAYPGDRSIAAAILTRGGRPLDVQVRAAVTVVSTLGTTPTIVTSRVEKLRRTGPLDVLRAHLAASPVCSAGEFSRIMARPDLTPQLLDALLALPWARSNRTFALAVAAYEHATAAQRTTALGAYAAVPPTAGRRGSMEDRLYDILTGLNERGPEACGRDLPLEALHGQALTYLPGVRWLANAALATDLPALPAEAAPVLGALAGTFTGTVGEFLTTVTTISS